MRKLPFILLLLSGITYAQAKNLDSLWTVWQNKDNHDTVRILALHKYINDGYLFTKPDSAYYFAQIEYDFSKKKKLEKYMATALNLQGVTKYITGQFDSAITYYTKSLELRNKIGDKKEVANSLNNMGVVYKYQGKFNKAKECFIESLNAQREINNDRGVSTSLTNIGNIYQYQGNYDSAIVCYTQSLRIQEKTGDNSGASITLSNIGVIYQNQKEYDAALNYYNKSLDIQRKISDIQGIANSLNNIGIIYQYKKGFSKALEYFSESLKIRKETNNKKGEASTLTKIGNVYREMGDSEKATNNLFKSAKIQTDIGDKQGLASTYSTLSETYLDLARKSKNGYNEAIMYGKKALGIANEVQAIVEQKNAANILWLAYGETKNYQKAFEMLEFYKILEDSIEREENQREVIQQKYKYEYEKQAAADSVAFLKEQEVANAQIDKQKAEIIAKRNQQYALYGGLLLVLIFSGFIYNRFKISQRQKSIIESQKEIVEEKNKEITDSISYAKRIQGAILPSNKTVKESLPNSFILYKPKDIVAGDFYWLETTSSSHHTELDSASKTPNQTLKHAKGDTILFAAADCTGHGVPGAMVSVVCNNGLNRSVREHGLTEPGKILDKTREIVIAEFEKSEEEVKDGMDIALCSLELNKSNSQNPKPPTLNPAVATLHYAGANNPLWIIRPVRYAESSSVSEKENSKEENPNQVPNDQYELIEIKADKQPIGKYAASKPYTTHKMELQKGDSIYLFTDGYVDQFGGEKGKKFKASNFKKLLLSIQEKSMEEQKTIINQAFTDWKGNLEQVDDICLIGVRI